MDKNTRAITAGHIIAILTVIVWGTTFISTKILLRSFTPIEILFLRMILGYIALWLTKPKFLKIPDKKKEFLFAGAGLCGVTLYFLFENIALMYSSASNISVIVSLAPFFTAIFARFFTKEEKLHARFFIGFLIAISGIVLISFNGRFVLKLNPLGDFLGILAAVVWGIYSNLTKKISTYGYHTFLTTRRTFFYGILFMIPALFLFRFSPDMSKFSSPENLFNIIFLGVGASAVCFVTWNHAVKVIGAVKTSVYIYMAPVITVITSAIVLKESLTYITAAGTFLTLTGLLISEWRTKKQMNEPA